MFRGALLALIGFIGLFYAVSSILTGRINLGGKGRDFFVSWSGEPVLFAFGVVFILALGAGALVVAWRMIARPGDGD